MLRNYFTIAWRTILRNPLYSVINIFGLSCGISSCLVIYLFVTYELSFNRNIPDADRIFRIYSTFSGDFDGTNRGVSTGIQSMVSAQFNGLETAAPIHTYSAKVFIPTTGEPVAFEREERLVLAPPSYFDLFGGYEWVRGSKESLSESGKVVLCMSQAKKYFGEDNPDAIVGREIHYNDSLVVMVSGLVQPPPGQTDLHFTDFISLASIEGTFLKRRITLNDFQSTNSSALLFIKRSPETPLTLIEGQMAKLDEEYKKHNKEGGWVIHYKLQPLSDLHYNSVLGILDNYRPAAHLSTLTTLSIVAVILLLLASINFVNLETARAVKRAREVGIRKVLGSSRAQLMRHFLAQSLTLTLLAVLVAIPMAELALVFFSDFIPSGVELSFSSPTTIVFLAAVVLSSGILSGLYPAFVLSSFRPVLALKSQGYSLSPSSWSAFMRKGLIVFQFGSAQLLIIGTLIIVSQIRFMLSKDLGFSQDAVIHINPPWQEKAEKRLVFKAELEKLPEIAAVSLCNAPPSAKGYSSNVLTYKKGGEEIRESAFRKFGDPDYLRVYGISLIAGRNLSPNNQTEILVNEAFLKAFDISADKALGEEIQQNARKYTIVGVMKNYHIFSLHAPYEPVYMSGYEEDLYAISAKLAMNSSGRAEFPEALAKMEAVWKQVYPERKFRYEIVDETIRGFYETEEKMSTLAGTATTMAIIISCLGLFGLASYTSIQRSKEVGIRKVLGATAQNILVLLSSDFLRLVGIAFILAAPLAWWGARKFLEDYTFHIDPGWPLFAAAGIASLVLAFVTVSYHALKTSFMNPVDSLKSE